MKTYDLLRAVLACVLLRLESEGRGLAGNCSAAVIPGTRVIRLGLGEQVWVRLRQGSDTIAPGQSTTVENCIRNLGWSIEIGVIRCVTLPRANQSVSVATAQNAARAQFEDMEAVRNALICCGVFEGHKWNFGSYTPMGPEGPDVGGYWVVEVADTFWTE